MTYKELVDRIDFGLRHGKYHEDFVAKPGEPLLEVNAWTYWQGVGVQSPRILVLGQDWGSLNGAEEYFSAIEAAMEAGIEPGGPVFYFGDDVDSLTGRSYQTDVNLAKGLDKLGYSDVLHKRYQDLFFTNLIPGYRKRNKSTGGFKYAWITEQVKDDFKDLIKILQPQIIICLGRETFRCVIKICGFNDISTRITWNDYLDEFQEPFEVITGEKSSFIFPMHHPGHFGTLNREKYRSKNAINDDWEKIRHWMDQHPLE